MARFYAKCHVQSINSVYSIIMVIKQSQTYTQSNTSATTHVQRRFHQSSPVHTCNDSRSRLPHMFHRSGTGCYRMAVELLALQTRTQFRKWVTHRVCTIFLSRKHSISMVALNTYWFNSLFGRFYRQYDVPLLAQCSSKLRLTTTYWQTDQIVTFTVLAGPVWQADTHVLSASWTASTTVLARLAIARIRTNRCKTQPTIR